MNNKKSAPSTLDKFQNPGMNTNIIAGVTFLSEVDALLNELLPHHEDVSMFIPTKLESFDYKDIHRVRLPNGVCAVRLPDGTTLARALDRKAGRVFWMRVRG
jgi:hypothetical protein